MTEEDGNGSEPERKAEPAPKACPVWVQGRCDGVTCNCAASGGGR